MESNQNFSLQKTTQKSSTQSIVALALGILSIPSCLIPLISVISGILAIVLGAISKGDADSAKKAKLAILLGIIGLVFGIIAWIISTLIILNSPEYQQLLQN